MVASSVSAPPKLLVGGASQATGSQQRSRSSSLGKRVAALADACVSRLRRAVTPTPPRRDCSATSGGSPDASEVKRVSSCGQLQPRQVWVQPASSSSGTGSTQTPSAGSDSNAASSPARPPRSPDRLKKAWQGEHQAPEVRAPEENLEEVSLLPGAIESLPLGGPNTPAVGEDAGGPRAAAQLGAEPEQPAAGPREPQGGVAVEIDVDFKPFAGGRARPPAALQARLLGAGAARRTTGTGAAAAAKGRGGRPPQLSSPNNGSRPTRMGAGSPLGDMALKSGWVHPHSPLRVEPPHNPGSAARFILCDEPTEYLAVHESLDLSIEEVEPPEKQGPAAVFLQTEDFIEFLATHDSLDLLGSDFRKGIDLTQHPETTEEVKRLCADMRGIDVDGVRALLAWRATLVHERRYGRLPSEEELELLCREDCSKAIEVVARMPEAPCPMALEEHPYTTDEVKHLCQDLRVVNAEGVRALLRWRVALRQERQTGELPSEEELEVLCQEDAKRQAAAAAEAAAVRAQNLRRTKGPASGRARPPDSSSTRPPRPRQNVSEQAKGVSAAMSQAAADRAAGEDKEVLDRLGREIEELTQALRGPGLTSRESHAIQKQLQLRRSEKSRAERAVRKGRRAQLEITGGDEAVQAIIASLPAPSQSRGAASSSSAAANSSQPTASDGWEVAGRPGTPPFPRPPGFAAAKEPPATGSKERTLAILLHPATLFATGTAGIGRVALASTALKSVAFDCTDPSFGEMAWRCACASLAHERALYCPDVKGARQRDRGFWRKFFLEQLWPARLKWSSSQEQEGPAPAPRRLGELGTKPDDVARDFKIQVSARFKPGDPSKGKLLVPLHQKLMLLRKGGESIAESLGKKEPPEFLDALMGHVMQEPVRLPSSGKVCDRRIVEEQLRLHGPRDPFDGSALEPAMLEPQEALRGRIEEWRQESRKKAAEHGEEHKLEEDQVRQLVEQLGGDLNSELVEMLLEADRLRATGARAAREAAASQGRPRWKGGDGEAPEEAAEEEGARELMGGEGDAAWWEGGEWAAGDQPATDMPLAGPRQVQTVDAGEEELGEAPKHEGAKLLGVMPPLRVAMFQPGAGIRPFVFARVFDGDATQQEVYEQAARNSVCSALNGFNACLLCYGQTGSGKTHTMFGPAIACGGNAGAVINKHSGAVMRALGELFHAASELERACGVATTIVAQYVQIYQDQVTCLSSGSDVQLREAVAGAPVLLQGAEETALNFLGDASALLLRGEERKRYAETAMNHRSSRAHTVLALKVSQRRGDLALASQLHLVDLAGSERVKKSRAQGSRLVEAVGINSSLMVLGLCIAALVEDRSHVPYYESRLTLLLRSALGGNSRTSFVICCHKEDRHADETLQALSFGERCSMVSTKAQAAMASSASEAISAIDTALAECSKRVQGLEARGKGHLPACAKLRSQLETLARRRRELAGTT